MVLAALQGVLSGVVLGCQPSESEALVVIVALWVFWALLAVLECMSREQGETPVMRDLSRSLNAGWFHNFFIALLVLCKLGGYNTVMVNIFNAAGKMMGPLFYYFWFGALQKSMEIIEMGLGELFASRGVQLVRWTTSVTIFVVLALWSASDWRGCNTVPGRSNEPWCVLSGLHILEVVLPSATAIGAGIGGIIAFRGLTQVMALADPPASSPYVQAEAAWVQQVFQRMRCAIAVQSSIVFLSYTSLLVVWLRASSQKVVVVTVSVVFVIQTISDFLCGVVIAGYFLEEKPQVEKLVVEPLSPTFIARKFQGRWGAKVWEMSARSITAGELLDVFCKLAREDGPMPQYNPNLSTTKDVAWHFIIPATRTEQGGRAWATSGSGTPDCHVTHSWSHLFVNLVAAVLSHALELGEYGPVVARLQEAGGPHALREELAQHGTLDCRYWICAFCVNQHASICNSYGCSCAQPKLLNDTNPAECEVNKFDDLLSHLKQENPAFELLVVVDWHFQTFKRAWCIAEIVEAWNSDARMKVLLQSSKPLDLRSDDLSIYQQLATLDVQECEASRPEDKEAILGKIPDVQLFNLQLQMIVFGKHGLLNNVFVGFGRVEAAARCCRRLQALHRSPQGEDEGDLISL